MKITAALVEGFTNSILISRYDDPQPIPDFHREIWSDCCSDEQYVADAAPRGHAKSSAVTLAYTLCSVMYRESQFVVIVSDTEGQAAQFLGDLKIEIRENDDLIQLFGIGKIIKDAETDLIVQMKDGYQFRIIAKGSEQKVRGLKWRGMRPKLIVIDDSENDESVSNPDRREKFRNWVLNALLPCGADDCKFRVVGTILHLDAFLERLMNNPGWKTRRYEAHNDDFSKILWPEKFSKERLIAIRQQYISQGNAAGYSSEYRNNPIDVGNAYFKQEDFLEMSAESKSLPKRYYAAVDFAISKAERADWTVIAVVSVDSEGRLYVEDVRRGRWDSLEIIDEMFSVQKRYSPDLFGAETGAIEKSIGPFLKAQMLRTGVFLNLKPMTPVKDKKSRARSLQARMRAGGVYFDKTASWYPDVLDELTTFDKGRHDDIVDALSWIGLLLDEIIDAPTDQEIADDEYDEEFSYVLNGANATTGY